MDKLLAKLEVYLDDETDADIDNGESSNINFDHAGTNFTIHLRPKTDAKHQPGTKLADVFAHELGHFMGEVLRDPEQRASGRPFSTTEEEVSGEKSAWHFAEGIRPQEKGSKTEKGCLHSYEQLEHRLPGVPMSLARLAGEMDVDGKTVVKVAEETKASWLKDKAVDEADQAGEKPLSEGFSAPMFSTEDEDDEAARMIDEGCPNGVE